MAVNEMLVDKGPFVKILFSTDFGFRNFIMNLKCISGNRRSQLPG